MPFGFTGILFLKGDMVAGAGIFFIGFQMFGKLAHFSPL